MLFTGQLAAEVEFPQRMFNPRVRNNTRALVKTKHKGGLSQAFTLGKECRLMPVIAEIVQDIILDTKRK